MLQYGTLRRQLKGLTWVLSVCSFSLVDQWREGGMGSGLATVGDRQLYKYNIIWGHEAADQASDFATLLNLTISLQSLHI